MRIALATLLALALVAGPAAVAEQSEPLLPGCADPRPELGEWRAYGKDLDNSRSQPAEDVIDASNAAALEPGFVFQVNDHGRGIIHGTPVVADGCVYFGTTDGWVFALNADTGELAWSTHLEVGSSGLLCTGVVGSTVVDDGRVFAIVSQAGAPYLAVLDQVTGDELWREVLDETPYVYNCASPVVFDGMVFAAWTGDQERAHNRGGFAIYEIETGERLAKTYTIPDEDYEAGYKGGGIWSTAAVDTETGYAYVGTSNPDAGTPEHPHTNSIIKIDVDRERETFGEIVDHFKGNPDRYLDLPAPPTCNPDPSVNVFVRSTLCAQMDLDFGASPNLFTNSGGEKLVGAVQKSGTFHTANAETMEGEWATVLSPAIFYGNGASAAFDGESIYVAPSPPGHMAALGADDGLYEWLAPIADLIHYQGVAYANGLVYTNDAKGWLNIFDADTGLIVGLHNVAQDSGAFVHAAESSGSTTIARNTAYVGTGSALVAYRP